MNPSPSALRLWTGWLLSGTMLCLGAPARAQTHAQQDMAFQQKDDAEPQKKTPGFFHRPGKDSPAEQWDYAEALEHEGKTRRAERALLALVHEWHDSAEAPRAQMAYAALLEKRGKFIKAFDEYQYLIDHFAGQFDYQDVLARQFALANHVMRVRRGKFFVFPGYESPERALPLLKKIVQNAPAWRQTPEAQFYIGYILEEQKAYTDAVAAYEHILLRYGASEFAPEAAFRRARCLYHEANGSPRDERRCRQAIHALSGFIRQYPDGEHLAEAQQQLEKLTTRLADMYYDRALYYDHIARHPRAALIAYSDFLRKFPSSKRSQEVNQRLLALKDLLKENHEDTKN